jgi:hypothetical protein
VLLGGDLDDCRRESRPLRFGHRRRHGGECCIDSLIARRERV